MLAFCESEYESGSNQNGTALVRDSFELTARGDIVTGPLARMETMQPGFNPKNAIGAIG